MNVLRLLPTITNSSVHAYPHPHTLMCVYTSMHTYTHTHNYRPLLARSGSTHLSPHIYINIYILIYSLKHWIFDESHGRIQWGLCELVWALKAAGGKWQVLAILDHLSLPRLGLGALRGETGGLLSPSCSLTRREPNC